MTTKTIISKRRMSVVIAKMRITMKRMSISRKRRLKRAHPRKRKPPKIKNLALRRRERRGRKVLLSRRAKRQRLLRLGRSLKMQESTWMKKRCLILLSIVS